MEIGWNILWFIVGISLLVTVHEFGHFWVARKLGFKVLRFSVGFGKPLFKRVGARAGPHRIRHRRDAARRIRAHARRARWRGGARKTCRAPSPASRRGSASSCMLAGPAANILFAVLVLWGIFWVQRRQPREAGGRRRRRRFAGRRRRPAQRRRDPQHRRRAGPDQGDASLGLLDAVSDDGKPCMAVRNRTGAERVVTLVDRRSRRCAASSPSPTSSTWDSDSNSGRRRFRAVLGAVEPDGPAAMAGLKAGDEIIVARRHADAQLQRIQRLRARASGQGNRLSPCSAVAASSRAA